LAQANLIAVYRAQPGECVPAPKRAKTFESFDGAVAC